MSKREGTRSLTEMKMQEIVRWQSLDKSIEEIATLMGMTPAGVVEIVRKPAYKKLRQDFLGKTFEDVDRSIKERKADVMLQDASADAAALLIQLLQAKQQVLTEDGRVVELDPSITDQRLVATAILDRGGYGPIQRKAVQKRIEMDPMLAKIIGQALSESKVEVIDAEIVREGGELPPKSERGRPVDGDRGDSGGGGED